MVLLCLFLVLLCLMQSVTIRNLELKIMDILDLISTMAKVRIIKDEEINKEEK